MKRLVLGAILAAIVLVIFCPSTTTTTSADQATLVDASTFYRAMDDGNVYDVHVAGEQVYFRQAGSKALHLARLPLDPDTARKIATRQIHVSDPFDPSVTHSTIRLRYGASDDNPWWLSLATTWLPFGILILIWFYFLRRMQSSPLSILTASRVVRTEPAKLHRLDAVGGYDSAKAEVRDLIDGLRNADRLSRLGGRPAHSALLTGPSGVGKTHLARAAAAEAGVPLLEMAGSDFLDLYVGTGARRMRELFDEARKAAPCVVLIDRIDVVGQRVEAADVDHNRREQDQTLNQLLGELEKVGASSHLLVLATTSRPHVLEPSLLRPGRLDRRIDLALPDQKDREAILKVCSAGLAIEPDVAYPRLSQAAAGLTGAHLRRLVDEAALLAARNQRTGISMQDFLDAFQRLAPQAPSSDDHVGHTAADAAR